MIAVQSAFAQNKVAADSLYRQEKYEEAAKMYESILSKQGEAADIYYNLGNCYYKTDNIPYAIVNYERALLLDPSDDDIRTNLEFARSKTTDKVTPVSEMFFITWWKNITNSMSYTSWTILAIISFLLMLAGILAYMFLHNITTRKVGAYGAIVLLIFTILANLFAYSQYQRLTQRNTAIVIAPAANVKSSPNESSTDLFIVHEGSKVEILDSSMQGWREVKFEEGKQGWLPTNTLEII